MKYGSEQKRDGRDANDLGRFGLGLKAASLSQCRRLTVVSKIGTEINGMCWDLDHVRKTGKWSVIILSLDEIDSLPDIKLLKGLENGTYVLWENFDKVEVTSNGESREIILSSNNSLPAFTSCN